MALPSGRLPLGTRAIQLRDPDTFFSRFLELYGRSESGRDSGAKQQAESWPGFACAGRRNLCGSPGHEEQPASRLLQSGAPDEKIFEEFYLAAFGRFPAPTKSKS